MSTRARVARAVEAFESAAAAVGRVEPGMAVFLVTRGQFSMVDMVQYVLEQIGPAAVTLWSWTVADYEVEVMEGLISNRQITMGRLVIDRSAEVRNRAILDRWRAMFGAEAVRVCRNHAKIARVWTVDRRVLLRGSMNLNWNPRFEQADVTEGGPDFDLVAQIEDELPVLRPMAGHAEADAASKLSKSWELGQLEMFRGLRRWQGQKAD